MVPVWIIIAALGMVVLWTLSTGPRITYSLVANMLFGLILPGLFILVLDWNELLPNGFRWFNQDFWIAMPAGLLLGTAIYLFQKPPSRPTVVHTNVFFQVLVVSTAEVFICWGLFGTMTEAFLASYIVVPPTLVAALLSAVVFGLHHIGHSPPFSSGKMILFLTVVGLFTSMFFFISRNLFGTLLFHNFFGMRGVIGSLKERGRLDDYSSLKTGLVIQGVVAVLIMTFLVLVMGETMT